MKRIAWLIACLVLWPVGGLAQAPDPFTSARVHVGPFALTPTLSLKDVGIDTNVFYEAENPKSDVTATITPGVDTWMRFGPGRLNVKLSAIYQFFAKYSDQRTLGTTDSVRLQFQFIHVRPWAAASFSTVRDRPGYEITARLRHTDVTLSGGADVPLTPRTTFGASFNQSRTTYALDETYLGYPVADALNRRSNTGTVALRYALTPLTTIVLAGDLEQERFDYSSLRNSSGFRIVPGVEFDASALITGSAHVGIRHFKPLTAGVPEFTGLVASVDLGYALKGVTRFAVQVKRDVAYSYDPAQPYYLLTGFSGSVTQALRGRWSVIARGGIQLLAYQLFVDPVPGGAPPPPGHVDRVYTYGTGLGHRLNPVTTISLNADYSTRSTSVASQRFRGLRVGTTVIYGF